ncbi:hypothetical protein M5X00_31765 [Paenibacillus alvei]|uniref:Uncharacterized protein n=1 Tax=Paenibacillus alvei TaxID=44250 RepID=A0ABT4H7P7_PAEAL|nr:hypothetical protein [Paenibacillus alvei]MCY9545229.1 hypothetical protein [Paenibacillus alvei]MCY9708781.1 hypothetical protein [Paenibacillus alvei]MCY9738379.1 hypothetical protein [Paenibacillus alvei]MCY9758796.1 hypothetical protein [Paenibacillus alvei]MCY9764990.1 hypothetical protein [Paenibacillus alvei]
MNEFLRFYDSIPNSEWCLNIYHSRIMEWCIKIDFKESHPYHGELIVNVQSSDVELAFAKALVVLKEWLLENKGGY